MQRIVSNSYRARKNTGKRQRSPTLAVTMLLCVVIMVFGAYKAANAIPVTNQLSPNLNIEAPAYMRSNSDEAAAWNLILVNKWNCIPDDYEVELTELSNSQSVDTRIYPALQEMFDAARSGGVYPVVVSGYRTAEEQQRLMDGKIAEYRALGYSSEEAIESAEAWVAMPGTSEHQLGIAIDINADGVNSAGYEVYDWLEDNACKYGFILRYPANKTETTGIVHEPWHYRYVGEAAATEIYNQGVCLEEYLEEDGQ